MRICLICTEKLPVPPVRGGAIQLYIEGLSRQLCQGDAITILCRTDPALPDQEVSEGRRFVRVDAPTPAAYFANVSRFLAAEAAFDWVVLFNRPAYLPQVAAAAHGARLALSLHNEMFDPHRLLSEEARLVLDQVEGLVCISDYVRAGITGLYPEYAAKMRTIRSGVDVGRFQPVYAPHVALHRAAVRHRLGLGESPVVLHVSRLSPKKGNHLVVGAMARVRRTHPTAKLLLVGSARYGSNLPDAYAARVQHEAKALLGEAVCLTGFVPPDQLPDLFLAGDLFICASQWHEPLARVHYEAMAAGLPIITTPRGGNGEVVAEGCNGLIVQPYDDPAAFAGAIIRLLDDPGLRERLGRAGRRLAEERYTWKRVAQEWQALLHGG